MINYKLMFILKLIIEVLTAIKNPILLTVVPILLFPIFLHLNVNIIHIVIFDLLYGIIIWSSFYRKVIIKWIKTNKKKFLSIVIGMGLVSSGTILIPEYFGDSPEAEVDYYISNDGADSNSGTSEELPWENITKINTELDGGVINEGDNIYFNRGNYFDDATLDIRVGGTVSNDMIFGAYGTGTKPIINFSANNEPGIWLRSSSIGNIIIDNFEIKDIMTSAIIFNQDDTTNITISNCDIHNAEGGERFRKWNVPIKN